MNRSPLYKTAVILFALLRENNRRKGRKDEC